MNGGFSVMVVWPETKTVEVGIDRFGTVPVYYSLHDDCLIASDDFWQVVSRLVYVAYDSDAVLSMVLLGYITGYRTLLSDVKEFAQAATHHLSFQISYGFHFFLQHFYGCRSLETGSYELVSCADGTGTCNIKFYYLTLFLPSFNPFLQPDDPI